MDKGRKKSVVSSGARKKSKTNSDETAAIVIPTTLVKEPPAAEPLWPKISSDGQDNYFLSNPRNDKRRLFFSRKIKHLDKNSPITNLTLSDDFECLKRFMMEGSKQMVIHHDGTTIKRNYKKFLAPPEEHPNTLCVQFYGAGIGHQLMLALVCQHLNRTPGLAEKTKIKLQYVPRNVIHGSLNMEDRWIMYMDNPQAMAELLRGMEWNGKSILVRKYDDVLKEEYNTFLRFEKWEAEMSIIKQHKKQ